MSDDTSTDTTETTETADLTDYQAEPDEAQAPARKSHWHNDKKTYGLIGCCCVIFILIIAMAVWWANNSSLEPEANGQSITPAECQKLNGTVFGNYCYTRNPDHLTWADSEKECRKIAGNLVSILSEEENTFIQNNALTESGQLWIGLKEDGFGGDALFEWSDLSAVIKGNKPYVAWASDEPEGSRSSTDQECVAMETGKWKVVNCGQMMPYMCKFNLASKPGSPQDVMGEALPGAINVSWVSPLVDGGRPVIGYKIVAKPQDPARPTGEFFKEIVEAEYCEEEGGCPVSMVVDGLRPKVTYNISVAATNEVGDSSYAEGGYVVVMDREPDAPMNVAAESGFAACSVTFPRNGYDGGQPVTSYTITPDLKPGSAITLSGASLNRPAVTLTGLTNGQDYQITVTATNAIGTSAASVTATCSPSISHPATPDDVVVALGWRSASISFTPINLPDAIKATANPICPPAPENSGDECGEGCLPECPPQVTFTQNGEASPIVLSGLVTFQEYSIFIEAEKNGLSSTPAYETDDPDLVYTPQPDAPGPVTNFSASVEGRSITLRFDYPVKDGDSPLAYFIITPNPTPSAGSAWINSTANPSAHSAEVSIELDSNTAYNFSVTATNDWNLTSVAVVSPTYMTSSGAPSPPVNVQASAPAGAGRRATVTWDAPLDDGGQAITRYYIVPNPATTAGHNVSVAACAVPPCSHTIANFGLVEDVRYQFYVVADNDIEKSAVSAPSTLVKILPVVASKPLNPVAVPLQRALNLTFDAPADLSSRRVVKYTAKRDGLPTIYESVLDAQWIVVDRLDSDETYTFTVAAHTSVGEGAWSDSFSGTPGVGPPSVPLDVVAQALDEEARITFAAPADDGGSPIASYKVVSTPGNHTGTSDGALEVSVEGLENGVEYQFQVYATNEAGLIGPPSPLSQAIKAGRKLTALEWVAGAAATVIVLCILGGIVYLVWWAWVEKELCWDDGDPNTRANARKRKEAEMAAASGDSADADGGDAAAAEEGTAGYDTKEDAPAEGTGAETEAAATEEAPATTEEAAPAEEAAPTESGDAEPAAEAAPAETAEAS